MIGASHRAGDAITRWTTLPPGAARASYRGDDAIVAARIAAEQPVGPPASAAPPAIGAIRLLSKRLGSTFLVSNSR
ncbi:MAG: hypothetical protein U0R70_18715 [Solirubrobacteraceae bacterium]